MTKLRRYSQVGLWLVIFLIASRGRGAESEIRLIGAPDGEVESSDRPVEGEPVYREDLDEPDGSILIDERETNGPPGMLAEPLDLSLETLRQPPPPPDSLSPNFAPLQSPDHEIDFEMVEPAPRAYSGGGGIFHGGLCNWLGERFSWLHGPPLPVVSERWNERTLYLGLFVGGFFGDELVASRVKQGTGVIGGVRGGLDFDDYWGLEGRVAFAGAPVSNINTGTELRTGVQKFFDASILFYPWTTARFRPFGLAGIGIGVLDFDNDFGRHIVNSTPIFPVGAGLKYRHDDWVAFRVDFTDTIALGADGLFSNTHNMSVTGAVEFRFGGPRKTYWPWTPRWFY
ncbi:MAG: outer membrane beta-barrel protein [Pirellulales bacterium]